MIRGEIYWADFGIPFGSEPGFKRPVLIIQDDSFNRSKINTIIVIPFTTNLLLENAPGNVFIKKSDSGLSKDSILVVSQITTIDRARLIEPIKKLNKTDLEEIEEGLRLILNL